MPDPDKTALIPVAFMSLWAFNLPPTRTPIDVKLKSGRFLLTKKHKSFVNSSSSFVTIVVLSRDLGDKPTTRQPCGLGP